MSKNVSSADNQQGSLRQSADDPSETTRRAPLSKKDKNFKKEDGDIVHAL